LIHLLDQQLGDSDTILLSTTTTTNYSAEDSLDNGIKSIEEDVASVVILLMKASETTNFLTENTPSLSESQEHSVKEMTFLSKLT
jgi:hypothetical protein